MEAELEKVLRDGVPALPPRKELLHSLDDAVSFLVFPTGVETGSVLLAGRWSMQEIAASETIARV